MRYETGEAIPHISSVTHPTHYQGKVEPIDLIEECSLNFNRGNIIKYTCRAGKKDDELADLKKAEYYLKREIERLERKKMNGGEND